MYRKKISKPLVRKHLLNHTQLINIICDSKRYNNFLI